MWCLRLLSQLTIQMHLTSNTLLTTSYFPEVANHDLKTHFEGTNKSSGHMQCRRLHKQEMLELRQQLKTASVSNKGGEKESDRLKKELDKARLSSVCQHSN